MLGGLVHQLYQSHVIWFFQADSVAELGESLAIDSHDDVCVWQKNIVLLELFHELGFAFVHRFKSFFQSTTNFEFAS